MISISEHNAKVLAQELVEAKRLFDLTDHSIKRSIELIAQGRAHLSKVLNLISAFKLNGEEE